MRKQVAGQFPNTSYHASSVGDIMAFMIPHIGTSRHHLLGILLLSGTLAGLASAAAAQTAPSSPPLTAETPVFLRQMPEPDRVIADIHGSDELDAAARQLAALNRLIDVTVFLSGTADAGGGPRLTTEELALNGRYSGAASSLLTAVYKTLDPDDKQRSDENSKRNQWNRLLDQYYNDDAFASALLQRYLTPELEEKYLGHMRQTRQHIQALNKHIQATQTAQARQDAQAAAAFQSQHAGAPESPSFFDSVAIWSVIIGVVVLGVWWRWRKTAHLSPMGDQTFGNERDSALNRNLGSDGWSMSATCPNCGGSGELRCSGPCTLGALTCPVCRGAGCSTCSHSGSIPCSACAGRGKTACSRCHGSGSISAN